MLLYEYEGKEIFKEFTLDVPRGFVVSTPNESYEAAAKLGAPVALKAQIPAGGRGKSGGIRFAENPEEAAKVSRELLGSQMKGFRVNRLLVEEKLDIVKEFYLGITVDEKYGTPVVIASSEGGVDIEEVAARSLEKIVTKRVDPLQGLKGYEARRIVKQIGLVGENLIRVSGALSRLYQVFKSYDARIAEINPLALTRHGALVAIDARIEIDDHSLFRHPKFMDLYLQRVDNTLEKEGLKRGVNYVDLKGNIAVMGNGAGMVMSLLDAIEFSGGKPACFLDTGGGLSMERMKNALELLLMKADSDPGVKAILLVVRLMISPPDAMALGLSEAITRFGKPTIPIVGVISGRKPYVQKAKELLIGSAIKLCPNVKDAIQTVVKIAG